MNEKTKKPKELKRKGLNDEYQKHAYGRIGYCKTDITSLRNYSEDLKSILNFYLERVTEPEERKEGKELMDQILELKTRSLKTELDYLKNIQRDIKKEVHGIEENTVDTDKAKQIKKTLNEIYGELTDCCKDLKKFINSVQG